MQCGQQLAHSGTRYRRVDEVMCPEMGIGQSMKKQRRRKVNVERPYPKAAADLQRSFHGACDGCGNGGRSRRRCGGGRATLAVRVDHADDDGDDDRDDETNNQPHLEGKNASGAHVMATILLKLRPTLMFFHHIFFLSSLALRLKTPACCCSSSSTAQKMHNRGRDHQIIRRRRRRGGGGVTCSPLDGLQFNAVLQRNVHVFLHHKLHCLHLLRHRRQLVYLCQVVVLLAQLLQQAAACPVQPTILSGLRLVPNFRRELVRGHAQGEVQ